MKIRIMALSTFLLLSATPVAMAEFKQSIIDGVSNIVSDGKDALDAVQTGITEGRKKGDSLDSAIIVSNHKELSEIATFKVRSIDKEGKDSYKLTIIFTNDNDRPVRLINITDPHQVLLLDEDNISSPLSSSFLSNHDNKDITISPKASTRIYWVFDKVEMPPKTLRLYGTDYSLKDI